MTFMLRDRPDGQVEIVLERPVLIGVFPERDVAEKVRAFLQADVFDWPEDKRGSFAVAKADVAEAEAEDLESFVSDVAPAASGGGVRNLPAVAPQRPTATAFLKPAAPNLTDGQKDAAFRRISEGETFHEVARDLPITAPQLRGMWTWHKRRLQAHIAEGGQQKCAQCDRMFTPSISHPDTCARCNHE